MANRGFGLLHRKFFDHPFWKETRVFSRAEAWIDIVFCLARGTNDPRSELKRGEFRASLTWLATRWNWDKGKAQRFMAQLVSGEDPMLRKLHTDSGDIRVYKVCKFEVYQNLKPTRETPSDTPIETPRETPDETLKPATVLAFTPTCETPTETPPDTSDETLRETKVKERINTVREKTPPSVRTRDEAFELFAFIYDREKSPDKYSREDRVGFIQLAKLRKRLSLATKASPEGWEDACWHYLQSPLIHHSLAELCARYGTFVKGPVDRYKVPVNATQVHVHTEACRDFGFCPQYRESGN